MDWRRTDRPKMSGEKIDEFRSLPKTHRGCPSVMGVLIFISPKQHATKQQKQKRSED